VLDPPGERIEGECFGSGPKVGGKPLRLSATYGDGKDSAGDISWRFVVAESILLNEKRRAGFDDI
jgi:hypothetical protein